MAECLHQLLWIVSHVPKSWKICLNHKYSIWTSAGILSINGMTMTIYRRSKALHGFPCRLRALTQSEGQRVTSGKLWRRHRDQRRPQRYKCCWKIGFRRKVRKLCVFSWVWFHKIPCGLKIDSRLFFLCTYHITPWNILMKPKNHTFEKENHFQVPC